MCVEKKPQTLHPCIVILHYTILYYRLSSGGQDSRGGEGCEGRGLLTRGIMMKVGVEVSPTV